MKEEMKEEKVVKEKHMGSKHKGMHHGGMGKKMHGFSASLGKHKGKLSMEGPHHK
jgi:hypothetical protein